MVVLPSNTNELPPRVKSNGTMPGDEVGVLVEPRSAALVEARERGIAHWRAPGVKTR